MKQQEFETAVVLWQDNGMLVGHDWEVAAEATAAKAAMGRA